MEITSEQSGPEQVRASLRKYASAALVVGAVIIHLLIAARSVGPMYVFDEVGYLANANVIAGKGADWALCGSSYAVGYSTVLAPLWWLPVSGVVVYQIAALLSAALGALAIWPATALARRFGARGGVALGIGVLVTLIPARALMDNYVLAENPLTLLVLCATILALRVAKGGGRMDMVLLGTVAGLAAVTHARAMPLVAVTVAWLAVRAITKRSPWLDAGIAALIAVALSVVGLVAQTAIGADVFSADSRVGDLVGELTLGGVVDVVLGQLFIQVISWSLLTVLGLFACALKARASVRTRGAAGIASAWWWLGGMVIAQSVFFVWVLANSADLGTRFDVPIFGRYLDPFVVPIAVLGAVTLWVGARKRLTTVALIASAVALAGYAVFVLPRISLEAVWIPFAIPGLVPYLDVLSGDDRPALIVATVVTLAGAVLLWASRGRARLAIIVALLVAGTVSFGSDWLRVDPLEEGSRAESITGAYILANPAPTVTLAADQLTCASSNRLQLELAGVATIVPTGGDYGIGNVVGPAEWPEIREKGYDKVLFTTWNDVAAWWFRGY